MMALFFNSLCSISYNAEGSRNDLGEPVHTLTVRAASVPCRIMTKHDSISGSWPYYVRYMDSQGLTIQTTHVIYVKLGQTIETSDIITDADGDTYTVAEVATRRTHKSALLQRIN